MAYPAPLMPTVSSRDLILFYPQMAVLAVRSETDHQPSRHILFPRYWFEMIGIRTCSVAAKVIKVETFRDGSDRSLVHQSMREMKRPLKSDGSVTVTIERVPYPAARLRVGGIVGKRSVAN